MLKISTVTVLQWGTHNSWSPEFSGLMSSPLFCAKFRTFSPKFGKKSEKKLPKNPGLMSYAPNELCCIQN